MRKILLGLGLCGIAALSSACAQVQPWERQLLARPDMAWEVDDMTATQRNHVYFSKEASLPGGSAGGGGCGCN
jgi:hypothetical protein